LSLHDALPIFVAPKMSRLPRHWLTVPLSIAPSMRQSIRTAARFTKPAAGRYLLTASSSWVIHLGQQIGPNSDTQVSGPFIQREVSPYSTHNYFHSRKHQRVTQRIVSSTTG